jgi:hypothetical protein
MATIDSLILTEPGIGPVAPSPPVSPEPVCAVTVTPSTAPSLAELDPERLRGLGPDQLMELAADIRRLLVSTLSTTGGHLGSNLGVVELTLALHGEWDKPWEAP